MSEAGAVPSRFPVLKPWPETRAPPCESRAFAFEPDVVVTPTVTAASPAPSHRARTRASRSISNSSSVQTPLPSGRQTTQALSPHAAHLDTLSASEWKELQDAYVCSFETVEVYASSELEPSMIAQLAVSAPAATTVFQAAQARGIRVLGIAPAHKRRGKWTPPIAGDPPRVYVGPAKPPFREATLFSPPK